MQEAGRITVSFSQFLFLTETRQYNTNLYPLAKFESNNEYNYQQITMTTSHY